jgi:hypothetical protein
MSAALVVCCGARSVELSSQEGYGLLSPTVYQHGGKTLAIGIVPDKLLPLITTTHLAGLTATRCRRSGVWTLKGAWCNVLMPI